MPRHPATVLVPLLLLTAVGIWLLTRGESARPSENGSPTVAANTDGDTAAARMPESDDAAQPTRTAANVATSAPDAAGPDRVTFFGRVIRSPGDTPISGATVTVRRASDDDEGAGTEPLAEITTTTDGTFEVETGFDAWLDTLAVQAAADGCVTRNGTFPRPEPGSRIDLGDIPLQRAIPVRGILVDEENVPVPAAQVMFVYIELGNKIPLNAEHMLRARSDANGRFTFAEPAFGGEWYVGTEGTGALVEPRSVKLGPDLPEYRLRIVVERPDPQFSITGIVVDETNRPMADVSLSASGDGFMGRTRSGPDGRFAIPRAGPIPHRGKSGTLLSTSSKDGMHRRIAPATDTRIAWGTTGVEVVMQRRQGCTVRVVDRAGAPVETFALFLFRGHGVLDGGGLTLYASLTRRGRHDGGVVALDGLDPGKNSVLVVPRDPALPPSGLVPFVVEAGVPTSEVLVTLPAAAALTVALATGSGKPVAGSEVEIIQRFGGSDLEPTTRVRPLDGIDRGRGTPGHVAFGAATTDAAGEAMLSLPPGRYVVRATSPAHVPLLEPVEVFAPATTARLAVVAAARIRATLGPAEALALLRTLGEGGEEPLAIVVTPSTGDAPPAAAVDENGHATVGGLTAGRHDVVVRYWLTTSPVRSGSVTLPVATVDLAGGELRELEIDLAPLLPATTFGRVIAGGAPLADVHCFLRTVGERSSGRSLRSLRVATDSEGRYRGLVPPGEYGFTVTYPAQPGPGWVVFQPEETWTLAPGESREQDFDFPLRRARIRFTTADGQPVVGHTVTIRRPGYHLPGGLETDGDGRVEVFPAPLRPFRVEVRSSASPEPHVFEDVDLPAGAVTGEISLQLPG